MEVRTRSTLFSVGWGAFPCRTSSAWSMTASRSYPLRSNASCCRGGGRLLFGFQSSRTGRSSGPTRGSGGSEYELQNVRDATELKEEVRGNVTGQGQHCTERRTHVQHSPMPLRLSAAQLHIAQPQSALLADLGPGSGSADLDLNAEAQHITAWAIDADVAG